MEDLLVAVFLHPCGDELDADRSSRFDFLAFAVESDVHGLNGLDLTFHGVADSVNDFVCGNGLHFHRGVRRKCSCRGIHEDVHAIVGLTDEGHRFGSFCFSRSRFSSRLFYCSRSGRLLCFFFIAFCLVFAALLRVGLFGVSAFRDSRFLRLLLHAGNQVYAGPVRFCPNGRVVFRLCGQVLVFRIVFEEEYAQPVCPVCEGAVGNGEVHIAVGLDLFTFPVQELHFDGCRTIQDFILQVCLHRFGIGRQFLVVQESYVNARIFGKHAGFRVHCHSGAVHGLLQANRSGAIRISFERECCCGYIGDYHTHSKQINQ